MNWGAMILMFAVGVVGAILANCPMDDKPKWHLWAGIAWVVFWCGPLLASLWFVGVFG